MGRVRIEVGRRRNSFTSSAERKFLRETSFEGTEMTHQALSFVTGQ